MPGHEIKDTPTLADVDEARKPLEALKAEIKKRQTTIEKYVKMHGPLVLTGSDGNVIAYADVRQTVKEMPDPDILLESLVGIGADDVLSYLVKYILTPAQLAKVLHKSPWKDIIKAEMQIDEGEGVMLYYGKANFGIRAKPAGIGDHVVRAGEAPMVNKYEQEEDE
jgi:hypothetical protein